MALDPEASQKYANNLRDARETLREVLNDERSLTQEAREFAKVVFDNNIQVAETANAFKAAEAATRDVRKELEAVIAGEVTRKQVTGQITAISEAEKLLMVEQEQALNSILSGLTDEVEKRQLIEQAMSSTEGLQDLLISHGRDMSEAQRELLDTYIKQKLEFREQDKALEEIEGRAKNIDDAFGLAGNAAAGIGEAFDKLGFGGLGKKLGIEDAVKASRKHAATITEGGAKAATMGDKFKVMGGLAKGLGKNLLMNLKDPVSATLYAIQQLVEAFKMVDAESGKLAKEFGISANEANKLVERANDAAGASGDLLVSTKDVLAAQRALNKEFGTAAEFSGEMAAEFASVQERTGLSSEAMGLFASNAMITGGNIKDQLASVSAVTMELNNQNGIALSVKDIQEGLAKTSKAALLTAGRNTKELANQVYQAKLLGVEQSKIEGIADQLLDFEGSIAKELEAELLLGRDINLEKARAAALEGDLATVAEEVNKQLEDGKDFSELNVIQQKALAESVGMTRDELASALVEQEKLAAVQKAFGGDIKSMSDAQKEYNKLKEQGLTAEEAALKIGDESLANQLESASQAEKFAAFQDKIQDLFIQIASALMPIVSLLTEVLEDLLNPIFKILNPILDVAMDLVNLAFLPLRAALSIIVGLLEGLQPIFNRITAPVQKLSGFFEEIGERIDNIFGMAGEGVGVFDAIGKIIEMAIMPGLVVLETAIDSIIMALDGVMNVFEGIAQILSGDIVEGFTTLGKGLAKILISPFQFIADTAIGIINGIIDAVNYIPGVEFDPIEGFDIAEAVGLTEGAAEGIESSSSQESSAPTIGLATGGIVTSPTTALIGEGGEPEAVIPLSKAQSMGFSENGKTIELLERLVAAVERGGIVELDGNKVGTALGLSSYKTQ